MDLTFADFVCYALCAAGALVVFGTLISRTMHARAESRALANRVICRLCLHVFEDRDHVMVVACPVCGASNEKGRSRRLG